MSEAKGRTEEGKGKERKRNQCKGNEAKRECGKLVCCNRVKRQKKSIGRRTAQGISTGQQRKERKKESRDIKYDMN